MSYDISFWKPKRNAQSPLNIYIGNCDGKPAVCLEPLDVKEIRAALKTAFPGFDPDSQFPVFESAKAGVEVTIDDRYVRFDIRGTEIGQVVEAICEAMHSFECGLYDPQEGESGHYYEPGEYYSDQYKLGSDA